MLTALQVASVLEAQLGSQYGVVSRCRANFTAVLFGSVPDHFYQVLYLFFERQFNEFGKVAGVCALLDPPPVSSIGKRSNFAESMAHAGSLAIPRLQASLPASHCSARS